MTAFEYGFRRQAMAMIEIEDICNTSLEIEIMGFGYEYLIIKTIAGITEILTYKYATIDDIPPKVNINYQRIEVNPQKITRIIQTELGNPNITNVIEMTRKEAIDRCPNIINHME